MATITHTTFACDRCGANPATKARRNLMVRASKRRRVGIGICRQKWDHFCARCAREVDAFFRSRPRRLQEGAMGIG